jgi:2-(1,2-epoxy-1,2-dihydrophenyl)acetyl-CoA isomerase
MNDAEKHVLLTREGALAIITLNRPDSRNALSRQMHALLIETTRACETDPSVRAVLLRAAGDHFMAGGDVKGFHAELQGNIDAHAAGFEMRVIDAHQFVYQIRRMPKPVLVAVQGGVAGIGMSVVMAADLVIAADDAFFTLAYRHIGLSPDGCASYLLPRIVGERRALEIALLGERFAAAQALAMGLVNRVVPRASLETEALRIATELANGPTHALAATKRLIRGSWDNSWDEQSHREAEAMASCVVTQDHREGVAAFVEKRLPRFVGR